MMERLHVKTILRCLSVCKSRLMFIKQPAIINPYLQHQRRDLVFVRHIPEDNDKKHDFSNVVDDETTLTRKARPECYSFHHDDENFTLYAKHEFPICNYLGTTYRVVGSCNGVICITNDQEYIDHETYLWNPTVQKWVKLPPPMFTYDEIGPFDHELGFGFDEENNDYKVVRVVSSDYQGFKVEIYSLSSGLWREKSHLALDNGVEIIQRACSARDCQLYLNGFVHWVGRCEKRSRFIVIAFDLSDEVFHYFEAPMKCESYDYRKSRLVVFQECLTFIHYESQKCSIWTMKEYGDSTSWAKHGDAILCNDVSRVFGLRRNGELLIEIHGGLYSYNYEAAKGKQLIVLDEWEHRIWKLLQEGHYYPYFVSHRIRNYDPEIVPKELGIRSKTEYDFRFSFHIESYVESLVLAGHKNSCQVESKTEESERIHEEDNNRVADLVAEMQNLGGEGRQIGGK